MKRPLPEPAATFLGFGPYFPGVGPSRGVSVFTTHKGTFVVFWTGSFTYDLHLINKLKLPSVKNRHIRVTINFKSIPLSFTEIRKTKINRKGHLTKGHLFPLFAFRYICFGFRPRCGPVCLRLRSA